MSSGNGIVWDHLIQDHDSTKANFGDVAAHPELVDINFVETPLGPGREAPPAGPQAKAAGGKAKAETQGRGERREKQSRSRQAQVDRLCGRTGGKGAASQPGLDARELD